MALCTNCGSRYNEEDAKKHVCELANIPSAGEEIKADNTNKQLE